MVLRELDYAKKPEKFRKDLVSYLDNAEKLMSSKPMPSRAGRQAEDVIGLNPTGEFKLIRNTYFKPANLLRMEIYGYVSENYVRDGEVFNSNLRALLDPPRQTVSNPFILGLRLYRDLFEETYSNASISRDARCMSLAHNNCVPPIMLFGFLKVFGGRRWQVVFSMKIRHLVLRASKKEKKEDCCL